MAGPFLHVVSFEVDWSDEDAYQRIYNNLQTAIKDGLKAADWWSQTTSFFIVRTGEPSADMAARVWRAAGLRKDKDVLVVMNVTSKAGKAYGAISDQTIFSLVPALK